jgi:hypothetical protein
VLAALNDALLADPAGNAEIYSQLGLTLTYHPNEKRVEAEAQPAQVTYVGKCLRGICTKKPICCTASDQRVCDGRSARCAMTAADKDHPVVYRRSGRRRGCGRGDRAEGG